MFINNAFAATDNLTIDNNKANNLNTDTNKSINDKVTHDRSTTNDAVVHDKVIGVNPNTDAGQMTDNTLADNLSPWTSLIPIALMFSVFYWFLIRPQEKRRREQEALIKSVQKGDRVITAGGIHGVVSKVVDDNTIDLEIANNTQIRMQKNSILEIPSRSSAGTTVANS